MTVEVTRVFKRKSTHLPSSCMNMEEHFYLASPSRVLFQWKMSASSGDQIEPAGKALVPHVQWGPGCSWAAWLLLIHSLIYTFHTVGAQMLRGGHRSTPPIFHLIGELEPSFPWLSYNSFLTWPPPSFQLSVAQPAWRSRLTSKTEGKPSQH